MVGAVRNAVASPQLDLSQFGPSYKTYQKACTIVAV